MYKIVTVVEKVVVEEVETEVTLEQYIGHALREAREETKLSLAEVVEKLDKQVSTTHLKNIEKGLLTFRLKDMILLTNFYQLHISAIFPQEEKAEE